MTTASALRGVRIGVPPPCIVEPKPVATPRPANDARTLSDPRLSALGPGVGMTASTLMRVNIATWQVVRVAVGRKPRLISADARHARGYDGERLTAGAARTPRVFATHGTQDRVLPIDRCSRRVIPRLRSAGYDVTYEEFDGGHLVTQQHARRAAAWL